MEYKNIDLIKHIQKYRVLCKIYQKTGKDSKIQKDYKITHY